MIGMWPDAPPSEPHLAEETDAERRATLKRNDECLQLI